MEYSHSSDAELPVVAVFDFDNTLTTTDSLMPFLKFVVGKWHFWGGLLWLSPVLLAYFFKLIPNWKAKELVLTFFLKDKDENYLKHKGKIFANKYIERLLSPEAIKRLHWHQNQGHQTFLISASLGLYLLPWSQMMNFNQVSCTYLKTISGKVTGQIDGRNCYGQEKRNRLEQILGNMTKYTIYAYGDSKGDRELLQAADYPFYRTFS